MTPLTAASENPITSSRKLVTSAVCNSPRKIICGTARRTAVGYDRKIGSTPRPYHSQIASVTKTEIVRTRKLRRAAAATPRYQAFLAPPPVSTVGLSMVPAFDAERVADDLAQLQKTRRRFHVVLRARPRQLGLDISKDAAGMRAHYHHPVAEVDRFFDAVGDEQHRHLHRVPYGQKLVLQKLAGLHVDRRERLVHQ